MKYYLENRTFGFSPDVCLFDSFDEAFVHLQEIEELHNREKNDRILDFVKEFRNSDEFNEEWAITEVFDWDAKRFGLSDLFSVCRNRNSVAIIEHDFGEIKSWVDYE